MHFANNSLGDESHCCRFCTFCDGNSPLHADPIWMQIKQAASSSGGHVKNIRAGEVGGSPRSNVGREACSPETRPSSVRNRILNPQRCCLHIAAGFLNSDSTSELYF